MPQGPNFTGLVNQDAQMAVAGALLTGSTSLTAVEPAPVYNTTPGDLRQGKTFLLIAHGTFTTAASAQGTLKLGFYYGTTATSLVDTGTPTPAASAVAWPWRLLALMTVRSIGTSGTAWTQGEANYPTSLAAWGTIPMPSTTVAAVTVDTTVAKTIGVLAQFSSSVTNTLTCNQFACLAIN